jgi:signal transduction histidine kinase
MTLRTRISVLTGILLALSLVVLGWTTYALLGRYLTNTLKTELAEASGQIVQTVAGGGVNLYEIGLPATLYAEVGWVVSEPPLTPESLREGTIPARSALFEGYRIRLSDTDLERVLLEKEIWAYGQLERREGEASESILVRAVLMEAYSAALQRALPVMVLTARPTAEIEASLAGFINTYIPTAAAILLGGGILAYLFVRRTLKPLEVVARRASAVSLGNFTPLPEPQGNDEAAALVRALNQMLDRLEAAFSSQSRFMADASHELRTPITAIKGHADYLLRRTELTSQQRESLEVIRREAERMHKLVDDLLDLTASQGRGWQINPQPLAIDALFSRLADDYRLAYGGEIIIEAEPRLAVTADEARLHQVFANLISNAFKAEATQVTLLARAQGIQVLLGVKDNGSGMAPEHLPHLFERFYRVDKARDRAAGGSGLGLAIVKTIVESHGGQIWVESQLDQGTTFWILLPRAELAKLSPEAAT